METPDGTIIQDGADIIDHFERGPGQPLRRYNAYPTSPVLLAVAHVFELFGGEGLLRPAMHYRWNFDDENLAFLTSEFALFAPQSLSAEEAEQVFLHSSGRMRKAATVFGVTPESQPLIETAFHEWLDLFEAHLVDHPYLLGNRPTIGDYGLIAAMWAHLYRDPAPTHGRQAARPARRPVGRADDHHRAVPSTSTTSDDDDDLIAGRRAPRHAECALLRYVSEEYLPEISAHVAAANEWLAEHPEIEEGTNGLDDPATRGLTGGRGLVGSGGAATFAVARHRADHQRHALPVLVDAAPPRRPGHGLCRRRRRCPCRVRRRRARRSPRPANPSPCGARRPPRDLGSAGLTTSERCRSCADGRVGTVQRR